MFLGTLFSDLCTALYVAFPPNHPHKQPFLSLTPKKMQGAEIVYKPAKRSATPKNCSTPKAPGAFQPSFE